MGGYFLAVTSTSRSGPVSADVRASVMLFSNVLCKSKGLQEGLSRQSGLRWSQWGQEGPKEVKWGQEGPKEVKWSEVGNMGRFLV